MRGLVAGEYRFEHRRVDLDHSSIVRVWQALVGGDLPTPCGWLRAAGRLEALGPKSASASDRTRWRTWRSICHAGHFTGAHAVREPRCRLSGLASMPGTANPDHEVGDCETAELLHQTSIWAEKPLLDGADSLVIAIGAQPRLSGSSDASISDGPASSGMFG